MSKVGKVPNQSQLPSLRGILDANNCCRGAWALNDAQHSIKDATSAFEFTFEEINNNSGNNIENNNTFPISGKYKGWFDLKTQVPGQNQRYEDEFELKFEKFVGDSTKYKITGNGTNKFGKFDVNGEMDKEGNLSMYRVYALIPIKRAPKSNNTASKKTKTPAEAAAHAALMSASREKRTPQPLVKCADILRELMRNPASVWFAEPVDYVKLNIPDYPEIIKKPICFNDIKVKLDKKGNDSEIHL